MWKNHKLTPSRLKTLKKNKKKFDKERYDTKHPKT